MNLTSSEKKTIALIGAAVLLYGALIVGAAALWASRTTVDERPFAELSTSGKQFARAYPTVLCDYEKKHCDGDFLRVDPNRVTRFPVPIGQTLSIRLSDEVSGDPWSIIAQYVTPNGSQLLLKNFAPKTGTQILRLASTRTHVLINVQINLPAKLLVRDSDYELATRGLIAVNTIPEGEKALLDAYDKAATGKEPKQRQVNDVTEFTTLR